MPAAQSRNKHASVKAPSLREAQREFTRNRLIAAAKAAFEEKGYVDVTIEDIVDPAGASRATFYLYFPSKVAILQAIMGELDAEGTGILAIFEANPDTTVDGLLAWLRKSVQFYEDHKLLFRALYQAQIVEPEYANWMELNVERFVGLWARLGLVPDASDEDLRVAATLFFAQCERTLYLLIIQGIEVNRDKVLRAIAESWHHTFEVGRRPRSAGGPS
jgi:AcrR family transcriptional regulator